MKTSLLMTGSHGVAAPIAKLFERGWGEDGVKEGD